MSFLPALGLRGRLLLLAILPAAAILTAALGLNYVRMRTLLLNFGQEILRDRVRAIAADIDRETAEAVTTSRVMAIAAENGMLDDRLQALRFTRDVLDSMPQFVGSYFGYEPDADGFDAFREAGSPFDPAVAEKLRRHIYASGNSVEPGAAFAAFRGRAPTVKPLLQKRGLVDAGEVAPA